MLKLRVTYTRPSVDVPFFRAETEFAGWFALLDSYAAQGKLLSRTSSNSAQNSADNPLEFTVLTTWRSVADNEEFVNDPATIAVKDARIAYCTEHLIKVEFERTIIVDEFDTVA